MWEIQKININESALAMEKIAILPKNHRHTGCPRRNVPGFGRVFLMLKYTDITKNTYIQS